MTQKEKAKELVNKFVQFTPAEEDYEYPYAKQCALIAVDEIILSTFSKQWYDKIKIIPSDYLLTDYWQEVKQEIEKL